MNSYITKGSAEYRQAITALFLGSFVTFAILYCTQPLIPLFSEHFGVTPAMASLTVSLSTGPLAVVMLFVAWLSDAVGRKRMMTFAIIAAALLMLLAALCDHFGLLLLIRALHGIVLAGFPGIAMVYISEEFDPAISGLVIGIYVSGNSIGGLAGRLIVSTVTDLYSWQLSLAGIGAVSLAAGLWFWRRLPESRNFSARKLPLKAVAVTLSDLLHHRLLLALYSIAFLIMGSFVTLYNYIGWVLLAPPYQLSQTAVGFVFLIYLVGTVSSTLMGRFSDFAGRGKVLLISLAAMFTGCIITLHMVLLVKILGIAIFTFGFFGAHSVAGNWSGQCTSGDKAQSAALYLLFYYLGASMLGAAGGSLLAGYGWNGVVALTGSSVLLAVVIALALFRYYPESEAARADCMK